MRKRRASCQPTELSRPMLCRHLPFVRIGLRYIRGTAKDFMWATGGRLSFNDKSKYNGWGLYYAKTRQREPNNMNSRTYLERSVVSDMQNNKWRTRKEGDHYPLVCQRQGRAWFACCFRSHSLSPPSPSCLSPSVSA